MKKIIFMSTSIALLFSIVFLSGCNPYASKYPEVTNGAVWICDEPDIFFHYVEGNIATYLGECRVDGSSTEICLLFQGPFVEFDKAPIEIDGELHMEWIWLLGGECKFKKDRLIIEVAEDELFDNRYETLTFRRYAKDEVEWIDGWPVPREGQGQ